MPNPIIMRPVDFNVSAGYDLDWDPIQYRWDFGDAWLQSLQRTATSELSYYATVENLTSYSDPGPLSTGQTYYYAVCGFQ